jgi:hypothetical protein
MNIKSLSALAALSLVLLLASSSLPTSAHASSDGPTVDPDLPWMTPQEFKVKFLFLLARSPRFFFVRHRRHPSASFLFSLRFPSVSARSVFMGR